VDIGDTIHFGYFDQHSEDVIKNPNQRVIEYLKETAELVHHRRRQRHHRLPNAGAFFVSARPAVRPHSQTLRGRTATAFLLQVLMQAPNVLILDEPTNDLDVQTLAVLEEYLEEFNGCVIVVSHDRYFLDRTVDTVFAFEGNGNIRQYPGNYSIYLDYKQRQEAAAKAVEQEQQAAQIQPAPPVPEQNGATPTTTQPKKLSYKEKREYEQLEAQIPALEAEKEDIEATLYGKPPSGYSKVQALSERLAELTTAIDTATERWMELAERAE
jgi:ATP-binding cassette subfamily F protein uup